jgi:hypothetical protein
VSIELPPAFRLETARTHLHRARDYRDAQSPAELFADALLDELKAAVPVVGAKRSLSGAELAAAVEAAEKAAKLAAENEVCACGHRWAEHVGRAGCMECDGCRERRPQHDVSWTLQALPTVAEVARAYDDEDRHFPQGGAS